MKEHKWPVCSTVTSFRCWGVVWMPTTCPSSCTRGFRAETSNGNLIKSTGLAAAAAAAAAATAAVVNTDITSWIFQISDHVPQRERRFLSRCGNQDDHLDQRCGGHGHSGRSGHALPPPSPFHPPRRGHQNLRVSHWAIDPYNAHQINRINSLELASGSTIASASKWQISPCPEICFPMITTASETARIAPSSGWRWKVWPATSFPLLPTWYDDENQRLEINKTWSH